jgi:hypothetical protein
MVKEGQPLQHCVGRSLRRHHRVASRRRKTFMA